MKRTIKLMSCAIAIVLAACSNDQKGTLANISPPIDAWTQAKSDALLTDSAVNGQLKTFSNGGGSAQVRSQVKGMTLHVIEEPNDDKVVHLNIEMVEQKSNSCVNFKYGKESVLKTDLQNKWTTINGLGRIRCIVDSCSDFLLIIEQNRTVTSGNPAAGGQTATVMSSVPVVLTYYKTLDHIPRTAQQENSAIFDLYLRTSNIIDGAAICKLNTSATVVTPPVDGGTPVPMPINLNGL